MLDSPVSIQTLKLSRIGPGVHLDGTPGAASSILKSVPYSLSSQFETGSMTFSSYLTSSINFFPIG